MRAAIYPYIHTLIKSKLTSAAELRALSAVYQDDGIIINILAK